LTYLYLLDYSESESDLVFGVPNNLYREDAAHAVILWNCGTSQPPSEVGSEHHNGSDACSSDFVLDPARQGDHAPMRDPSHRPSPLALHIQIYKVAGRFGIPCLAAHACAKFERRIKVTSITTHELIEAAKEAYADEQAAFIGTTGTLGLSKMKQALVQTLRGRWSAIRNQSEFEDVVLQRPEFGRDILRLL
jgi:hypothetical protein